MELHDRGRNRRRSTARQRRTDAHPRRGTRNLLPLVRRRGGRGDGTPWSDIPLPRGGDAEFVISDALGRIVARSGIRDAGAWGVREFGWNPRDAAPCM
ncbi:MAG: hypothetical protein IPP94_17980 [Ignavibacteria bacterium]|nr:hypothetical protein [Ignavibacteria bacterium]